MADYTILIVDYEPRSLEQARAPLAAAGFKVETAADGVAGLEAFERLKPDLVLIEAMLPKKHGFEVCQIIKKSPEGKRTPVFITTGVYKGRKYRSQALHIYGCDEYVEKPLPPETLVELCRRFLGGGPAAAAAPASTTAVPRPAPTQAPMKSPLIHHPPRPAATPSAVSAGASAAATIVSGLTEDEIMARLDAILPDDGMRLPSYVSTSAVPELEPAFSAAVPCPEEASVSVEARPAEPELALPVSEDSPAQDDLAIPEFWPEPAAAATPATEAPTRPEPTTSEQDSQVVRFDATRARRRHRSKGATPSSDATPVATPKEQATPASERRLETEPGRKEAPAPAVEPAVRKPSTQHIEPAAASARPLAAGRPQKSRVPLWVWAAVAGVVTLGALYLVTGSSRREEVARPVETAQATRVARPVQPESSTGQAPASSSVPAASSVQTSAVARPAEAQGRDQSAQASAPLRRDAARSEDGLAPKTDPARVEKPAVVAAQAAASRATARPPVVAQPTPSTPSRTPVTSAPEAAKPPVVATPPPPVAETRADAPAPRAVPPAASPAPQAQPNAANGSVGLPMPPPAAPAEAVSPATQNPAEPDAAAPPKKAVPSGAPLNLYEVDKPPVPVSRPAPAYTDRARSLRQTGSVFLNLLVDEKGKVTDVQLIQGIPESDLNDAAVRAARTWVYEPAIKDGGPVKVWKFEKLNFTLEP